MPKYYKFIEIAYLVIAAVFVVEAIVNRTVKPENAYVYLAFSVVAVFMYFFKKKFRKKFENDNNKK